MRDAEIMSNLGERNWRKRGWIFGETSVLSLVQGSWVLQTGLRD
jgi:hypothetical protein